MTCHAAAVSPQSQPFHANDLRKGHIYCLRSGSTATVVSIDATRVWYTSPDTLFGWTELGVDPEVFARSVVEDVTERR